MRSREAWLRLSVVVLLASILSVASGAAVNRVFDLSGHVLWIWAASAVVFTASSVLLQYKITEPLKGHTETNSEKHIANPTPVAQTVAHAMAAKNRLEQIRQKLSARAERSSPRHMIPQAWQVSTPAINAQVAETTSHIGPAEDIFRHFHNTPSCQMLILGGPCSGKSVVARSIEQKIFSEGADLGAVPFLVSADTWNPYIESFSAWIGGKFQQATGEKISDFKHIIVIVDEFDRLPEQAQSKALAYLATDWAPPKPLILISRTDLMDGHSDWRRFYESFIVVELQPLPPHVVRGFVLDTLISPDPYSATQVIGNELQRNLDGSLVKALSSSFMLSIATRLLSYSEALTLVAKARDFGSASVEDFLIQVYIEKAAAPYRWSINHVHKWLKQIASKGSDEYTISPSDSHLPPKLAKSLFIVAAGIPCLAIQLATGSFLTPNWITLVCAYFFVLMIISIADLDVAESPRIRVREKLLDAVARSAITALFILMAGGLAISLIAAWPEVIHPNFVWYSRAGIVGGAGAFAIAFMGNLASSIRDGEGFLGIYSGCIVGLAFGSVVALLTSSAIAVAVMAQMKPPHGLLASILGMLIYAAAVAIAQLATSDWCLVKLTRVVDALAGRLPLLLLDFLEDCEGAGIIRRRMRWYTFRHPAMHRLYKASSSL